MGLRSHLKSAENIDCLYRILSESTAEQVEYDRSSQAKIFISYRGLNASRKSPPDDQSTYIIGMASA